MPDPNQPKPQDDIDREPQPEEAIPHDDHAARVRQQRAHIEGLTGLDPLRGGIDD